VTRKDEMNPRQRDSKFNFHSNYKATYKRADNWCDIDIGTVLKVRISFSKITTPRASESLKLNANSLESNDDGTLI